MRKDVRACIFCRIIGSLMPARVVHQEAAAWVIEPLRPVTKGHVIVIPTEHVTDYAEDPIITGMAAEVASRYGSTLDASNLITSRGKAATQSVMHLHFHVVPRRPNDGLLLPWTYQNGRRADTRET